MSQQDFETLMQETLPVAKRMLEGSGPLIPFGAVMRPDGEVLPVGVETASCDLRASEVIDVLTDHLTDLAQGRNCTATAMLYEVRFAVPDTRDRADAVAISLCHTGGKALMVLQPFARGAGTITYGQVMAYEDENRMFRRLH